MILVLLQEKMYPSTLPSYVTMSPHDVGLEQAVSQSFYLEGYELGVDKVGQFIWEKLA